MEKNHILKIAIFEGIFFILIVGFILFFSPKIIGTTYESGAVFFEFKNADYVLIDDNFDFSSPEKVSERGVVLEPGEYYWKAVGVLGESKVGNFVIESELILSLEKDGDKTFLKNRGNVPAKVFQKSSGLISGEIILDVGERKEVSSENKFVFEGRQDD